MAEHNATGRQGEEEAIDYLLRQGFTIRERNWRFGRLEIDIIAENDLYLAIIEVKTRTTKTFGAPEEFVSRKKQRHLITAAQAYSESINIQKDIYFDIIAIALEPEFSIEHIHQAFYP